jgi:ATP-dependent protease ClpP protease subunit
MERDHWIEPKRAVELGMVSKIIHNREELEAELKKIKS